jgi:hypothetical protein
MLLTIVLPPGPTSPNKKTKKKKKSSTPLIQKTIPLGGSLLIFISVQWDFFFFLTIMFIEIEPKIKLLEFHKNCDTLRDKLCSPLVMDRCIIPCLGRPC